MLIDYLSDLHLEFYGTNIEFIKNKFELNHLKFHDEEKILCLAGDIGNPFLKNYELFLKWISKIYDKILLIADNHEYYSLDNKKIMKDIENKIYEISKKFNNVIFLNNDFYEIGDYLFIGSTLWSRLPCKKNRYMLDKYEKINDFKFIYNEKNKNITYDDYDNFHQKSIDFINKVLDENKNKKIILLTHHLPTFHLIHKKYKNYSSNIYFASDLDHIIFNNHILCWICGHTHMKMNITLGKTKLLINPIGYPGENIIDIINETIIL
jgi:predicted phosphohydrolase